MYHSVTFGDKNTWDDWRLVPSSRPLFNPPTVKTQYVDIPGADGKLDLTETLSGYPTYNNREGTLEFIVLNGFKEWYQAYSDIMDYLHGQKMRAVLEDDPDYFYEGRFSINEWNSKEPPRSIITINYDVGPYKWETKSSIDDWLWDPFNFKTGVARSAVFKDIVIQSSSEWTQKDLAIGLYGRAPICPRFIVSTDDKQGMDIRFVNTTLGIDHTQHFADGSGQCFDFIFYGEKISLYFKGKGTVSIDFRVGRL